MKHAVVLILAAAAMTLAGCGAVGFAAEVGYAQFELSGDVGYTLAGDPANPTNSIESNFGLDDPEKLPYVRAQLDVEPFTISASGFQMDASSTGTLTSRFGSIPAGIAVDSELELKNLRGSFYFFDLFDLLPVPFLTLKPGLGVDYFDILIEAEAAGGIRETIDAQAAIPVVCLLGGLEVGPIELVGEGSYFEVPSSYSEELDGKFYDLEGLLKWHPQENLTLFVGYRVIQFEGNGENDDDSYDLDIAIKGWILGGGIKF